MIYIKEIVLILEHRNCVLAMSIYSEIVMRSVFNVVFNDFLCAYRAWYSMKLHWGAFYFDKISLYDNMNAIVVNKCICIASSYTLFSYEELSPFWDKVSIKYTESRAS